ncbi:MAG: response regulator transcription factor [Saprospiraceae bacterium]
MMTGFEVEQDLLLFAPEQELMPASASDCWNILIVDDEESVHDVTQFALEGFVFDERDLRFCSVYSATEAIALLKASPLEYHVILLDIVMEHRCAGLEVIDYLRNERKNDHTQIVVRTGNPGLAPEDYLVHHYEINDYEEKNILTAQRLRTSLTTALRNCRNMKEAHYLAAQRLDETQVFRQALRQVTFVPEEPSMRKQPSPSLISLPTFLKKYEPSGSRLPKPVRDLRTVPDIGVTLQFIQGKIASTTRKAIAIYDYTTNQYRYVSDNIEEVTGLGWVDLVNKFQQVGHYSPDIHKIEKINRHLSRAYSEASGQEKEQFVAIFDYRITPVAPHSTRILEYATPLHFNEQGQLLLSLHIFSNINHLKKASANSILALHTPEQHQYFSISDYRSEEIFIGQREQEIVEYSDRNLLSKEIAQEINLSVHTVDTHLRNLRDRLGVTSTNALISYCKEITHLFGG